MVDGRDALDVPFTVADKPVELVITAIDRRTMLRGVVRQGPTVTSEPTVVVFAEDQQYWTARSRRIRTVRPRSDGVYEITGLPVGSYLITAVDDIPAGGVTGPAFLATLISTAERVTIGEGGPVVLDIPVR
jgi:hypothetical protein